MHRRRVWGALVGVAQSATQRGWSQADLMTALADDGSGLGRQQRRRFDKAARVHYLLPADAKEVRQEITRAWNAAANNVERAPARRSTTAELRNEAEVARHEAHIARDDLNDDQRKVMTHAIAEAGRRHTQTPVLPRRKIAEACDLTEWQARQALAELTVLWYLPIHVPGEQTRAKATVYRIPTVEARAQAGLLYNGGVAPIGGGYLGGDLGSERKEEDPMMQVTVTASARTPEDVAALLRTVLANDPAAAQKIVDQVPVLRAL